MCKRVDAPVDVKTQNVTNDIKIRRCDQIFAPQIVRAENRQHEGDHNRSEHVNSKQIEMSANL